MALHLIVVYLVRGLGYIDRAQPEARPRRAQEFSSCYLPQTKLKLMVGRGMNETETYSCDRSVRIGADVMGVAQLGGEDCPALATATAVPSGHTANEPKDDVLTGTDM